MSTPEIRQATVADAVLLARLSAETFYETFAKDNKEEDMHLYLQTHFLPHHIEAEFRDNDVCFFIAFVNNEPAGYAKLSSQRQPQGLAGKNILEIERLYVRRAFHGRKIGYALMTQCISFAVAQQKEILWLGVWEHNPTAIAFYQKVGFERFGQHEFVLGNDVQTDWLMKLSLDTSPEIPAP